MKTTRVRFIGSHDGILSLLVIETVDRPELIAALADALFRLRLQVVRFETRVFGRRLCGRFEVVEFDGARIVAGRRLEIQTAVLAALESAKLARDLADRKRRADAGCSA